jgi:hypothetical protein
MTDYLNNKYLRLVVIILSAMNILGYYVLEKIDPVVYFFLISIILKIFTDNWTIILGVPLIIVNFFAVAQYN